MATKIHAEPKNTKLSPHNIIKYLVKHGMKEPVAEQLVDFIEERTKIESSDLATKSDVAAVKQEMTHMATKADLEKTNAAIEKSKNDMVKWQIGIALALASIIITCFKIFGR